MENKTYFYHFMNIGIGTIFNIILGLLITPIVTRLVDTADYGALSMFTTYSNMAVMVLCLGLDQALIRFYYEKVSVEYKQALIRKTAYTSLGITVIVCIGAFFVINGDSVQFDFKGRALVALVLFTFIQLFLRFALIILRVEYLSKLYALINVLRKIIYLVLVVYLMMFLKGDDNLFFLICATVFSVIIPLIIAVYLKKSLWLPSRVKYDSELTYKSVLSYGLPFILSMGITTLFEALDKLSINYFYDYSEVGIYASAINIVNIFTIIQTTFNTVWAPMAIEHYTRNPNDKSFFLKINELITFIMFLIGFFLIAFKDIFILLLGQTYREASFVVPFLIFHPIMYTISETTAVGIDFKKKSYFHIIVAAIACIVNAWGNILLVPIMGGKGAAISTGVSYIIFFVFRSVFGLRYFNYEPSILKIITMVIIMVGYAFYSSFISNFWGSIAIFSSGVVIAILLYRNAVRTIIEFGYKLYK